MKTTIKLVNNSVEMSFVISDSFPKFEIKDVKSEEIKCGNLNMDLSNRIISLFEDISVKYGIYWEE